MKLRSLDPLLNPSEEDMLYTQSNFVEHFYTLLTDKIEPPYAVSIDGLWGTGKTTVMKLIEKRLREKHYPTFWFNPWEYRQTKSVVLAFLQCLSLQYKEKIKEGGGFLSFLLDAGLEIGVRLIANGVVSSVTKFGLNTLKKFVPKDSFDPIQAIRKEFPELVERISDEEYEGRPLFIFFDDLDRCLPEDTIQLLEGLKNLFITPGCRTVFVCGIDTHIVKQFIRTHYRGIEESFAINYFRKIFNLTISMPHSIGIRNLLFQHILNLYEWDDPQKTGELAKIIYTRGLQAHIYSIRSYINILTNLYIFMKFNPDYQLNLEKPFVINLLILKEAWYPLYEELIKEAFRERSNMGEVIMSLIARYGKEKELLSEQEAFLNNYLGKDSAFAEEYLSEWLAKYPTLA